MVSRQLNKVALKIIAHNYIHLLSDKNDFILKLKYFNIYGNYMRLLTKKILFTSFKCNSIHQKSFLQNCVQFLVEFGLGGRV